MSTFGNAETRVVAGLARIRSGGPQDAPPEARKTPKSAPIGGEGVARSGTFWPAGGEYRAGTRSRPPDLAERKMG